MRKADYDPDKDMIIAEEQTEVKFSFIDSAPAAYVTVTDKRLAIRAIFHIELSPDQDTYTDLDTAYTVALADMDEQGSVIKVTLSGDCLSQFVTREYWLAYNINGGEDIEIGHGTDTVYTTHTKTNIEVNIGDTIQFRGKVNATGVYTRFKNLKVIQTHRKGYTSYIP